MYKDIRDSLTPSMWEWHHEVIAQMEDLENWLHAAWQCSAEGIL